MATASNVDADTLLGIIHGAIGEAVDNMPLSPTLEFGDPSSLREGDCVQMHSPVTAMVATSSAMIEPEEQYRLTLPLSVLGAESVSMSTGYLQAVSDLLHRTDVLHWDSKSVSAKHCYQVHWLSQVLTISYRDAFLGTLSQQTHCDTETLVSNFSARQYLFESIVKAMQQKRELMFAEILSSIDIELEKRHEQWNFQHDPADPSD